MSENEAQGFAGLIRLTSKIDAQRIEALKASAKPASGTPSRTQSAPGSMEKTASGTSPDAGKSAAVSGTSPDAGKPAAASGTSPDAGKAAAASGNAWKNESRRRRVFLFVWVVLVLIVWIAAYIHMNGTRSKPYVPDHAGVSSAPSAPRVETPRSPVQPAPQKREPMPTYTIPSIGNDNILSFSEICWCLRQEMILDTVRSRMNSNSAILSFNTEVRDYNSRCGSYRYRTGDRERAREAVNAHREEILNEALHVAKKWNNEAD